MKQGCHSQNGTVESLGLLVANLVRMRHHAGCKRKSVQHAHQECPSAKVQLSIAHTSGTKKSSFF